MVWSWWEGRKGNKKARQSREEGASRVKAGWPGQAEQDGKHLDGKPWGCCV